MRPHSSRLSQNSHIHCTIFNIKRTLRAHVFLFHCISMRDRAPYPMTSCMLSLLDHWSSCRILAPTPGGQEVTGGDNHELVTCDFDMETNFVFERDTPLPRKRGGLHHDLCLYGLCALDADMFSKRRDPWSATTLLAQGATVFAMSTRG